MTLLPKTLGQTHKSFGTGVTDGYVGDIEVETYTDRVEEMFEGRTQPAIGEPYRKVRVTTKEVEDYRNNNGIDAAMKTGRSLENWNGAKPHITSVQNTRQTG